MSSRRLPSGARNAYAGGYSESVRRQVNTVTLPDKIKCGTCGKIRPVDTFSKRQLDTLRNAMVTEGARAMTSGRARCRNCTGGSLSELKCSICDQVKSMEDFAKNQRQERDTARCLNCVQKHSEADPVLEGQRLIAEGKKATATSGTASQTGTNSMKGSGNASGTPSAYDDDDDDDLQSIGGGTWLEGHGAEKKASKGKERTFTGYDAQGKAHRMRFQPETAESVHSGWGNWGVTAGSTQRITSLRVPPKRESRFAKVKSPRFEKSEAPSMSVPEPTGQTVDNDEDNDNDLEEYL
ncbi:hypothetical protein BO71DRAFT_170445 [Aspergillus ellipticus CBS 707.79]|uniref:Stc1 domain-containing protein n=1 Tax=Aspergillus ellipticus CBS 707.79 TaxID=1448320 RepID=A0A319DTF5_9EURO|nr:hypothetical protein BO71DRAFT_170445 [Aspergillus ellipticus CBS 707.79]